MKKNKIVQFVQNTIAYALPVIMQQFFIYPLMAKKLGAEKNGLFLSLLALNYFITNITASVLVNTRLLQNEKYKREKEVGDYNVFLIIFAIFNSVFVGIGTYLYADGKVTNKQMIMSVILVLLFLYHDYITVQYRIELKFEKILINNLILCVGYVIGIVVLYYFLSYWQVVFLVPYFMTLFYDIKNTNYILEPIRVTSIFGDTIKQYFILMGSTLLTTAVTYGDRLILYPLMDGNSVSIFSAAQLVGKMMQMLSTPITTFILAYLIHSDKMYLRIKRKYVLLGLLVLLTLYVGAIEISHPMIKVLYPLWAEESLKYIYMTALNGIILMLGVIANVFVLRFCNRKFQLINSLIYLITYVIFSFSLEKRIGLWGFCMGNLLSAIVQLCFLGFLLFKYKIVKIEL